MIGFGDEIIFLNNSEFSQPVGLSGGVSIKGIMQNSGDDLYGGLAEARQVKLIISAADYQANKSVLSRGSTITVAGKAYKVESYDPYGSAGFGDFAYGVLGLAV